MNRYDLWGGDMSPSYDGDYVEYDDMILEFKSLLEDLVNGNRIRVRLEQLIGGSE